MTSSENPELCGKSSDSPPAVADVATFVFPDAFERASERTPARTTLRTTGRCRRTSAGRIVPARCGGATLVWPQAAGGNLILLRELCSPIKAGATGRAGPAGEREAVRPDRVWNESRLRSRETKTGPTEEEREGRNTVTKRAADLGWRQD